MANRAGAYGHPQTVKYGLCLVPFRERSRNEVLISRLPFLYLLVTIGYISANWCRLSQHFPIEAHSILPLRDSF